MKRRVLLTTVVGTCLVTVISVVIGWKRRRRLNDADFAARYAKALPALDRGMRVYHLGHSLVGRDMPEMLDQLAKAAGFAGHEYHTQLGWGASLKQHWQGEKEVPGFASENANSAFRPAKDALASGFYDAIVLTEMVEIRDAVKYHESAEYLAKWAQAAWTANPVARVYLYETWHRLDDPDGWLSRIDDDLRLHWEGDLLRRALMDLEGGEIYVVPGGQVLAALVRAMEAGQVPGFTKREQLFARDAEGVVDPIHLNDIGTYVIGLTHFAVLYHQSPVGLPHQLKRADGSLATAPFTAAVPSIQRLVWQVVTRYAATGVSG